MTDLMSVDDALSRILANVSVLPLETIALENALGRVLAEPVHATENIPPFDNSSMDGYAIRAADIAGASTDHGITLQVVMDIPAGAQASQPVQTGQAARIMTGAPIPPGADAVIPVEDTNGQWNPGTIPTHPYPITIFRQVSAGGYIRPAGEDITSGALVFEAGTVLRPQEIGVLASLGQAVVTVIRQPRVAILTTGDELLEVDRPLAPGKIRDSNSYTLASLVTHQGGIALRLPIARDTLDAVRTLFDNALAQSPDMIISSAGVSVGAADLIRTVMAEYGEIGFWRINLRPGKPLAFGHIRGIPFFGLPGNPVSAMVTFDVLVRPALLKQAGKSDARPQIMALAAENMKSDGRRSYIRVKLARREGEFYASATGTQSSGALMSMVLADGLLVIPEDMRDIPAGTRLPVLLIKPGHEFR